MICKVCQDLLYGHKGRRDSASRLSLSFWHHESEENIRASAEDAECYICRIICDKLERLGVAHPKEHEITRFTSATLQRFHPQRFPEWSGLYRLDFKLEQSRLPVASFVLKHTEESGGHHPEATPISANTSDPKVFDLARKWVEDCEKNHAECRIVSSTEFHPTRLLDLRPMRQSNNGMVRLVSQKDTEKNGSQYPFEGRYVTLSHRWGQKSFIKLRAHNRADLHTAILLKSLPQTFQDAILFACELGVKWIWIDALCIIQGNEDDWLHESAQMDKIYAYSYCNISATAAMDSAEGLFRAREPEKLWFDTVSMKTQDLSMDAPKTVDCTICDLNFWAEYIDNAPVNTRSWVLQERLLAPRVVHWCADQIAFECHTLDRAECRPEGLPNLQVKNGQLIDQARLKVMNQEAGGRLRGLRLAASQGSANPQGLAHMIEQIEPQFYIYEIWKRIVEIYTKMDITEQGDRLIALSGIARMMKERLRMAGIEDQYLAGMWQKYLESQLLWYVNDEEDGAAQPLENTRPKAYRAPSFSWASVETPRGITFPETTDQKMLIEVQIVRLLYKTEADIFGILTDGYLVLKGLLRKVEVTENLQTHGASDTRNRYSWRLTTNGVPFGESQSIVHLDSPASKPSVFGPAAQVYCLPVSEDDRHLNCLLVQAEDGDHGVRYKRVGLTKILTLFEGDVEMIKTIKEPPGKKETLLGKYYRRSNESFWGENHICII